MFFTGQPRCGQLTCTETNFASGLDAASRSSLARVQIWRVLLLLLLLAALFDVRMCGPNCGIKKWH